MTRSRPTKNPKPDDKKATDEKPDDGKLKDGDILNSTGGKWQPGQRPAFTTARERTRMDKDRVAALVAALEPVTKQIGDEEESVGAVRWRVNKTDGGKNFSGSYFDDAQMKAIMEAPDDVVQPAFKENIRMMNEAVKTREGQPFLADYWKAITGKGYDSKARMKVQLFTPIGMEISSAGNFNATIFNIGYFENKINRWLGQSGKKKFWKEWADEDGRVDVDAFRRDVNELLGTHFADDRNVRYPDNTKKEKMYSFLGVKPFLPGRKDWNTSVKDRKMIQKFRADRMKNLTPGMGDNFPISFGKARARYMPGEPARPPVDDLGFYSRVAEVAAGDKIPTRATGDQMLATIVKQPGVKKEEIAWLGLEDFLRGKDRVTKEELGDFIRENDVRLEETVMAGDPNFEVNLTDSYESDRHHLQNGDEEISVTDQYSGQDFTITIDSDAGNAYVQTDGGKFIDVDAPINKQTESDAYQAITDHPDQTGRRYPPNTENYQLPGAEPGSYREMVLRLPSRPSTSFAEYLKAYKERFPNSDQPVEAIQKYWRDGHQVTGTRQNCYKD